MSPVATLAGAGMSRAVSPLPASSQEEPFTVPASLWCVRVPSPARVRFQVAQGGHSTYGLVQQGVCPSRP